MKGRVLLAECLVPTKDGREASASTSFRLVSVLAYVAAHLRGAHCVLLLGHRIARAKRAASEGWVLAGSKIWHSNTKNEKMENGN